MEKIKFEILQYSYWEHFKSAKELSLVLPPEHPKRILLQKESEKILAEIKELNS
jgi:hypothetical protein